MGRIVFTDAGLQVVQPDPASDADANYESRGQEDLGDQHTFQGRIPIVYNNEHRAVYLGEPNWYHHDLTSHHGIYPTDGVQGYFGGGPDWGNGALKWWEDVPSHVHQDVAHSLQQAGYQIPNPDAPPESEYGKMDFDDESLWHGLSDDPWEDAPYPSQ